jgi:hypothetical protein
VQLPSASIDAFRDAVDWSKPDAANQVNALARERILRLIQKYRRGGNKALGVYRDKDRPALVTEQFQTMIGRAAELPNVLPELRQYLLNYPNADLPGADSFFYWEKVDFGSLLPHRARRVGLRRGHVETERYRVLSVDAQRLGAGRIDRHQGIDPAQGRRRQDAVRTRKSTRRRQGVARKDAGRGSALTSSRFVSARLR